MTTTQDGINHANALSAALDHGAIGSSSWIITFSGRRFWPLHPNPDDLCIEDIAHALSNICRFTGHVSDFYSVSQHSVLASELMWSVQPTRIDLRLQALLHDASEAYLCDLARPVKHAPALKGYRLAEHTLQTMIYQKFGVPLEEPPELKQIDRELRVTERRQLFDRFPDGYDGGSDADDLGMTADMKITPWMPRVAESRFLSQFVYLQAALQNGRPV